MAITDLQISDTLETGAPSIKYTGNEGPQPPTQTAQADPMLVEEYEKYVFEMQEQGLEPMSFEQFKAEAMSGMAEGGRARFGLGSFVRKLIPKEVAKVAEKAAPFVAMAAPQFALPAAIAGGLGKYKRTGNLMGSALSGLGTYGLGALSPGVPGVRDMGPQSGMFTTQPFGGKYNLGNIFKSQSPEITGASGVDKRAFTDMPQYLDNFPGPGAGRDAKGSFIEETIKKIIPASKEVIQKTDPGEKLSFIKKLTDKTAKKIILGAMAGTGLYTALSQKGEIPLENIEEIARGEGMDIEGIRAEVREALAGGEATWNELKKKYPYIGEHDTKIGAAEGGRIGFYAGGGAGYPPVTWGQQPAPAPQMPPQQARPNPMPAPQPMAQPNPMAARPNQNPMGGRMNPMAGRMNPMAGGIMGGGMNPMGGRRMAQEGGRIGYLAGGPLIKKGIGEIMKKFKRAVYSFEDETKMIIDLTETGKYTEKELLQLEGDQLAEIYVHEGFTAPKPLPNVEETINLKNITPKIEKAYGGRIRAQEGGLMDLGGMEKDYRNDGGFVPIGGQEKADDVPARLSKNEFVFTADAVRNAGGGDIDKGAGIMERVMENLEQGGKISEETQGLGGAQRMFETSERLSEVV